MEQSSFLTPEQLSERWHGVIKVRTLTNWRCADSRSRSGKAKTTKTRGPKFLKVGGRVLYSLPAVEEWEEENMFNNTSQYGSKKEKPNDNKRDPDDDKK